MNRLEAIRLLIENLEGDELIVHANGSISRESFHCRDREENFYLLGSMGLPASVGLGLALSRPERRVIVLDGDGNILMGFGNLALIGALKPSNLIHLVLDNQAYGTTGNQPTISSLIALDAVAEAAGFSSSVSVGSREELRERFAFCLQKPGPHFIQVLVSQETPIRAARIPYTARQIKERFMGALSGKM
jgi:thiamine pyrophosphate-dependent acetolactate synthase large subunit-like protein